MLANLFNFSSSSFKKIGHFLPKKSVILWGFAVFFIGIIIYSFFSSSQTIAETAIVKVGEIKQSVEVTGSVQASRDANLSFQTLGAVSYVGIKIGDIVNQGKILASLQSGDAEASLLQAKAQLDSSQAILDQLTQGSRKEEVAIKQQSVDNAKNSLEQTYLSLPDTIRNVDSTTADIIKNKLSTLFNGNGYSYTLSFSSCDQGLQSLIEMNRMKIEKTLSDFKNKNSGISVVSSKEDIDSVFDLAYNVTVSTNELVSNISNLLLTECSIKNTTLDTTRTTLSVVRTTMNALFSDITLKRSSLNSAKNILSQASRDLDLAKAGTDTYKLKSQTALVAQAEAQVAGAESGLRKIIITAPFSGIISDVLINEGETVTSGKTVISILASGSFEIEAKVPEIDIVKIKTGAYAEVTLDAYGKAVLFPAIVTRINPTATIEGSVPVYKVIVTFSNNDSRIKSGMTANINIMTENKSQAIILPSRFVEVIDNARGIVILRKNNKDINQNVLLGIRGKDGLIEILSGVISGDEVVAPSTGIRSAQKQTQ